MAHENNRDAEKTMELSKAKQVSNNAAKAARDISNLTFEDAMRSLEQVVTKLESGQAPLATLVDLYERGTLLKARCEFLLQQAEMKIEKIQSDSSSTIKEVQPMASESTLFE